MRAQDKLKIKLFADGANIDDIMRLYQNPMIKGFTTNPTLMRKAGVSDYESFAKKLLKRISDRPISFEVFADEFDEMEAQAHTINSWGDNVYVKIPITNTKGESSCVLIKELSYSGVKINVTAIMTEEQVSEVAAVLHADTPAVVSVFAGRIADTAVDPSPIMARCVEILKQRPLAELLWASPRELLNIFQANDVGCHIITATPDVLKKLELVGKELSTYSLETVQMFYNDAASAGYSINTKTITNIMVEAT